jgi:hypothetical protein
MYLIIIGVQKRGPSYLYSNSPAIIDVYMDI